jgi:HNH endonuclease
MWRGGKALSYGPGWKAIKEHVRARDRVCHGCGKTAELNGRALDVHHLIPFRFSGDNSFDNLVALCRSCHMRADDHGRAGSATFLEPTTVTRPTKRELRRLRQLIRAAEALARRREAQRNAMQMRAHGASLREIARAVGASHETVNLWLKGNHRVEEGRANYFVRRAHHVDILSRLRKARPGSSVGRARV